MRFHAPIATLTLCLGLAAPALAGDAVILDATFDDKPVDTLIGEGGAILGEPVSVPAGLDATVREGIFATRSLEIADVATSGTPTVRFEFLDDLEVVSGNVEITASLRFSEIDGYVFYVREQGTAGSSFCSITFTVSGTLTISDANGAVFSGGSYAAGVDHLLEITQDLSSGTWSLSFDGSPLVENEPHGITERGVGSILIGAQNDAELDGSIHLDRLRVTSDAVVPTSTTTWGSLKSTH